MPISPDGCSTATANRCLFEMIEPRVAIALYEPEIAPNTGNIIRLAANVGAELHLIEPLGFALDNAKLRRAGLDYREFASIAVHADYATFCAATQRFQHYALSTRAATRIDAAPLAANALFLFGPESRGLPLAVLSGFTQGQRLRLPMRPENRSLNLANAAAVCAYLWWSQHGFAGAR